MIDIVALEKKMEGFTNWVGFISSIRTRYIRDHLERENNELFSATTVTGAPCRTLRVERIILMWIAGVEYTRHVRYLVVLKESGLVRPNWTYHYLNLQEVPYASGHKLCPPLGV